MSSSEIVQFFSQIIQGSLTTALIFTVLLLVSVWVNKKKDNNDKH